MMELLTAQHPHEVRLPSGLMDLYVQYKQDTRAIVAWLVDHGPGRYKATPKLSIKDLFDLVDAIRAKAVQMPDIIAFHFRQAIAARSRLSKVYRKIDGQDKDQTETVNHEFFTNRYAEKIL